ncbi:thiamine pyrophosphate-binding protein [uncultured Sneathiella sp.]|uniref:thiamine pyrophosphate-binding protein n=1 Tax=uncultured Sneathiella sp. TaxID=879315 RepID=UPI0030ECDD52|tara:strand:+ start:4965 stop:6608 length:1644 start_codon:yes stop_codon:yes gene_type:complete
MASNVAEYLWRNVSALGVKTVFGLPGITTLPAMEAMRRLGEPDFVVTRHEQCAGHMADATARLGAKIGVLLVDLGPGLANTLTAALAAMRDSSPLLIIAGQEHQSLIGREVWHEMPEIAVFSPMLKFCERVESTDAFPRLLDRALRLAMSGRPGPVLLSVPKNLWNEEVASPFKKFAHAYPPEPAAAAVDTAVELLLNCERPVAVVGGGGRSAAARESIRNMCERWEIPVVTSPNGRGALAEDHPLCLGHAGRFGQAHASETLKEADLVLSLGCRLDDLTTHNWSLLNQDQAIIQVDIEASMIAQNWKVDLAIVGDAGAFSKKLSEKFRDPAAPFWNLRPKAEDRLAKRKYFYEIYDDIAVKPQAVMNALEENVSVDHTIVMGGGRFQQFAGEWLVRQPENFFYAANSGTVGFALSGAIGAAIASPERQVICVLGDGDFSMHCQELETAVRTGANVKVVILNDFAYGAMKARQEYSYGTEYGNADFAVLAKSFGADGRKVIKGNEIVETVKWLLQAEGPALIDVHIDLEENRSLLFGHDIGQKEDTD